MLLQFADFGKQEQKANASSNMSVHPSVTHDIRMNTANINTLFETTKFWSSEYKELLAFYAESHLNCPMEQI